MCVWTVVTAAGPVAEAPCSACGRGWTSRTPVSQTSVSDSIATIATARRRRVGGSACGRGPVMPAPYLCRTPVRQPRQYHLVSVGEPVWLVGLPALRRGRWHGFCGRHRVPTCRCGSAARQRSPACRGGRFGPRRGELFYVTSVEM